MKRKGFLSRELVEFFVVVVSILAVLVVLWIAAEFGWVLTWIAENWLPFTIGFAVAVVMKLLAAVWTEQMRERSRKE
jgi:ABC-type bacteriocin/lantibiotic exporter with double-glycine peptidase domain